MSKDLPIDLLQRIGNGNQTNSSEVRRFAFIGSNLNQFQETVQEIKQLSIFQPQNALDAALGLEQILIDQEASPNLLGESAWLVAWTANQCTKINIAAPALERAEQLFRQMNDPVWLAACQWQQNAIAWTKPDFIAACSNLETALAVLVENKSSFVSQCRLSLIDAYFLIQNYEAIARQIEISKTELETPLDLARLAAIEGNLLRRQHHFQEAEEQLQSLIPQFKRLNAPIEAAKTIYLLGLIKFVSASDYTSAADQITQAMDTFHKFEIDLWITACQNILGQIRTIQGFPHEASRLYAEARETLEKHQVLGMLADNLNDNGQLILRSGDFPLAISFFKKARHLYHQLGLEVAEFVSAANLGDAYTRQGKYQEALEILETSLEHFNQLKIPFRAATANSYLGRLWKALNNPQTALVHLAKTEELNAIANQEGMVAWARLYQVDIHISTGNFALALERLSSIETQNIERPLLGLVKRYQALIAFRSNNVEEAEKLNHEAAKIFESSSMPFELAECMFIFSKICQSQGDLDQDRQNYWKAMEINQGIMPDIHWRAQVGLGEIAEMSGDLQAAYQYYWSAFETLTQTRQTLWQPTLSAGLLSGRQQSLDQTILLSNQLGTVEETFAIIEGSKSLMFRQNLHRSAPTDSKHLEELKNLRQEIVYMQQQLRLSSGSSLWQRGKPEILRLQNQLKELTKRYTTISEKFERSNTSLDSITPQFSLAEFRQKANTAYPDGWVALDYHITKETLTIILLTATEIERFQSSFQPLFSLSLDACDKNIPQAQDLVVLGNALIPPKVEALLTPDTVLIIAPHRSLHHIPWPSLILAKKQTHLVENCCPVITPSIQTSFELLTNLHPPEKRNGLVVGLSEHPQYPDLPNVQSEIAHLANQLPQDSRVLLNTEAKWETFRQAVHNQPFHFIHLATHILPDTRSGKLSRIILYDQNIWVDQLSQLAPLPRLVTLSACSGMYNFVMPGDELIGFSTACLSEGAKTVVGSQWPLLDIYAGPIMNTFYDHYLAGNAASSALAYALRAALKQKISPLDLGGLICFGAG